MKKINEKMNRYGKPSQGFTLIELLTVVAIIGILTAIIMPNFTTARATSRDGKRVSDISQLSLALQLFSQNCQGQFPTSLTATCPTNSSVSLTSYLSGSVLPKDPLTNQNYIYAPIGTPPSPGPQSCTSYHLGAVTERGATGLTGDYSSTTVTTAQTLCVSTNITYGDGTSGTNDFDGASGKCVPSSTDVTNYCYDVHS